MLILIDVIWPVLIEICTDGVELHHRDILEEKAQIVIDHPQRIRRQPDVSAAVGALSNHVFAPMSMVRRNPRRSDTGIEFEINKDHAVILKAPVEALQYLDAGLSHRNMVEAKERIH